MAGQLSGIVMVVGTLGAAFAMNLILWLLVKKICERNAKTGNRLATKTPGWTMFAPRHTSFLTLPAHPQHAVPASRPRRTRPLQRVPFNRLGIRTSSFQKADRDKAL